VTERRGASAPEAERYWRWRQRQLIEALWQEKAAWEAYTRVLCAGEEDAGHASRGD